MPFIRGRYHINPIAGAALEAAREAEAALAAREQESQGRAVDQSDGFAYENEDGSKSEPEAKGPIHRVEIEAAELVPPHSGYAARGFVARVHRQSAGTGEIRGNHFGHSANHFSPHDTVPPRSETHVFSDHRDLLNFLKDEFAQECKNR